LENNKFLELANLNKVLGDESRMKILWLLMDKELCVSELAEKFRITPSAASHQLKELRLAGLLKRRKDGKRTYYTISNTNIHFVLRGMQKYLNTQRNQTVNEIYNG